MKTKKLLAFIIAMVFVVSVCPFAYAEGEITLTYEAVTGSQAPTAIVSDLSLPTGYEWSSNNAAIAIGQEADGVIPATVTRALREDTAVTLTATKDGACKTFDLTVKAKTTQVIAASSYANGENTALTNELNWDTDGVTGSVIKEDDGNYCFSYDFSQTDGYYDRYRLTATQLEKAGSAEIWNLEFDFKYDQTWIVDLKFCFGSTAYGIIRLNKGNLCLVQAYNSTSYNTDWNHLSVSVNTYDATVTARLNGTLIGTANIVTEENLNTYLTNRIDTGLTYLEFQKGQGGVASGEFRIDNFVLSVDSPGELSEEEQGEYIESLEWNDLSEEKASAVTAFEKTLPTAGGVINWSSDNSAVQLADKTVSTDKNTVTLGKTATVIRPEGKLNANTVVTATHKNGAEYGEKKFYISVMPKDYSTNFTTDTNKYCTILADFEEGTDDEDGKLDITTSNSFTAGVSEWITGTTEKTGTTADVSYVADNTKGNVAKISGVDKKVWLAAGQASNKHTSATTGMDIKFSEGTTENSYIRMYFDTGSVQFADFSVYDGKVTFKCSSGNKTFNVATDEWFRLDIDTNFASRTSDIYINGVKMNDEPLVNRWHEVTSSASQPVRFLKFEVADTAELLIDNIAVTCSENEDLTLAEAGVIWAQLYKDEITTTEDMTLPVRGPKFANAVQLANGTYTSSGSNIAFDNGATLTWTENGDAVTEIDVTKPYVHSYTLTATSGEVTATTTINITEAPVVISVATDGAVTVTGDTSDGKLIVATMNGDKLDNVEIYESFEDISVADIDSCKLIFVDLSTLTPKAFAASK